ncbi:hypothetical protein J3E07_001646 [Methanococcus voltae]|uniref:Uncharacterized protein n=1 Tax=Methanococcus voltae TaxID=2188 RepID=A0A8J7S2M8_METVO|nr:hypothetical protein [Methanococcus voltae]MBP2202205.1 hypothetical protein [Methanococcus voltae]
MVDEPIKLNGLKKLYNIDHFKPETKAKMENFNILILPEVDKSNGEVIGFYEEASDFYKYLKATLPDISIDYYENEGEFKTYELHAADVWIPTVLMDADNLKMIFGITMGLPVSIIANFMYDYIHKKYFADDDDKVAHAKMIIKEADKETFLEYEGPVSGIKDVSEWVKK